MVCQFMKVLSNVKYQYFLFGIVVTMQSIDSNNLKLLHLSLYVINNQSEIEPAWDRDKSAVSIFGVRLYYRYASNL